MIRMIRPGLAKTMLRGRWVNLSSSSSVWIPGSIPELGFDDFRSAMSDHRGATPVIPAVLRRPPDEHRHTERARPSCEAAVPARSARKMPHEDFHSTFNARTNSPDKPARIGSSSQRLPGEITQCGPNATPGTGFGFPAERASAPAVMNGATRTGPARWSAPRDSRSTRCLPDDARSHESPGREDGGYQGRGALLRDSTYRGVITAKEAADESPAG